MHERIHLPIALGKLINGYMIRYPQRLRRAGFLLSLSYNRMAISRYKEGIKMVSSARLIITDRLHAYILCTLLGKEHCFLDNNYGKNRHFFDAWTSTESSSHWCNTLDEAINQATVILSESDRYHGTRTSMPFEITYR